MALDSLPLCLQKPKSQKDHSPKRRDNKGIFASKTAVIGLTERKGKAKAVPMLHTYVEKGSKEHTDNFRMYY